METAELIQHFEYWSNQVLVWVGFGTIVGLMAKQGRTLGHIEVDLELLQLVDRGDKGHEDANLHAALDAEPTADGRCRAGSDRQPRTDCHAERL